MSDGQRSSSLYLNRELSWLAFNARVLHEALDAREVLKGVSFVLEVDGIHTIHLGDIGHVFDHARRRVRATPERQSSGWAVPGADTAVGCGGCVPYDPAGGPRSSGDRATVS